MVNKVIFFLLQIPPFQGLITSFTTSSVMDHNALSIKTYMAIMAERDDAIRERNIALEERKRAFAERDMAMLQRDAAIEERDSAIKERDKAIAAFRSVNCTFSDLAVEGIADGAEDMRYQETCYSMADAEFDPREIPTGDTINIAEVVPAETAKHMNTRHGTINITEAASETAKRRKVRQPPEEGRNLKSELEVEKENAGHDLKSEEELEKQIDMQKDDLGLDQINFDESSMPGPVCSCTGTPQPCYKWGNGGWQSACCTTTISRYPLPQVSNKRYTRLGGRKMSGSAFSKLLNRLAAEGHDLYSAPLDLKDHWAKHGSNRYSTLK